MVTLPIIYKSVVGSGLVGDRVASSRVPEKLVKFHRKRRFRLCIVFNRSFHVRKFSENSLKKIIVMEKLLWDLIGQKLP
jgi:hypothetical protein